jgi:hypothetical protein
MLVVLIFMEAPVVSQQISDKFAFALGLYLSLRYTRT